MNIRTPLTLTLFALLIGTGCDNSVSKDFPPTSEEDTEESEINIGGDEADAPDEDNSQDESEDSDESDDSDDSDQSDESDDADDEAPTNDDSSGPSDSPQPPETEDEEAQDATTMGLPSGRYDYTIVVNDTNCGPELEDTSGDTLLRTEVGIYGDTALGWGPLSIGEDAIDSDGNFLIDSFTQEVGDGDCIVEADVSGAGYIEGEQIVVDAYVQFSGITRDCGSIASYAVGGQCTADVTHTFTPAAPEEEAPSDVDTTEEMIPEVMPDSGTYTAALEVTRSSCAALTPEDSETEFRMRSSGNDIAVNIAELGMDLVIEDVTADGAFDVPEFEVIETISDCEVAMVWSGTGQVESTDAMTWQLDAFTEIIGGACTAPPAELPCALQATVDFDRAF